MRRGHCVNHRGEKNVEKRRTKRDGENAVDADDDAAWTALDGRHTRRAHRMGVIYRRRTHAQWRFVLWLGERRAARPRSSAERKMCVCARVPPDRVASFKSARARTSYYTRPNTSIHTRTHSRTTTPSPPPPQHDARAHFSPSNDAFLPSPPACVRVRVLLLLYTRARAHASSPLPRSPTKHDEKRAAGLCCKHCAPPLHQRVRV